MNYCCCCCCIFLLSVPIIYFFLSTLTPSDVSSVIFLVPSGLTIVVFLIVFCTPFLKSQNEIFFENRFQIKGNSVLVFFKSFHVITLLLSFEIQICWYRLHLPLNYYSRRTFTACLLHFRSLLRFRSLLIHRPLSYHSRMTSTICHLRLRSLLNYRRNCCLLLQTRQTCRWYC